VAGVIEEAHGIGPRHLQPRCERMDGEQPCHPQRTETVPVGGDWQDEFDGFASRSTSWAMTSNSAEAGLDSAGASHG
jgi:hypothetical protein